MVQQEFGRLFRTCNHLPFGAVAYLYYITINYVRKDFLIGVKIKIVFLRLCKRKIKKVVIKKKNSDFK